MPAWRVRDKALSSRYWTSPLWKRHGPGHKWIWKDSNDCCTCAGMRCWKPPIKLAALDRAGVVDAGGLALVLLLEGMVLVEGNEQIPPSSQWIARHLDSGIVSNGGRNSKAENEYSSRYCLELLLEGPTGELENVLERLLSFCESLEKAWDNGQVRVHLHTDQPFAIRNLVPEDVYVLEMSVEDMRYQTHIFDDRRESIRPTGLAALVSGSGVRPDTREHGTGLRFGRGSGSLFSRKLEAKA